MIQITETEQLLNLPEGNTFLGVLPKMHNSKITIKGINNIFYCDEGVSLEGASIIFNGNDSVIYLCKSRYLYKISIAIHNQSVCYFGTDNYFNEKIKIIISEHKHFFCGNDCLFSHNIEIRNADPHLIYDINTSNRINHSKSIYIGDHVWVGLGSIILKGSQIHSGSIIGAKSVVAGKKIPSNESWGGNPCSVLRKGVFWDRPCVHAYTIDNTAQSCVFNSNDNEKYIFYEDINTISFDVIDKKLDQKILSDEKYLYLKTIACNTNKNRFARNENQKEDKFITKFKRCLKD